MTDADPETATAHDDRISVELHFPPAINYALVHNNGPVARYLQLENLTEEDIAEVDVTIDLLGPDGALTPTWQRHLPHLQASSQVLREDFADLAPDLAGLKATDEAYPVRYHVDVSASGGTRLRAEGRSQVLAHNEWFNSPSLYESIAAFVQPNTASVTQVLRAARDLLEKETGSSSLQGYQDGSRRAALIGGAIYEALRQQRISYVGVPASFERTGQKVRPTASVLRDQLGNCIDLSVTYAACLEQAGLSPLIWIVSGHAFAGFFLTEERLSETVSTDANHMINLIESRHALAVEMTGIGPGSDSIDYSQALRAGEVHFRSGHHHLLGMVDIALAHRSGIKSLPSNDQQVHASEAAAVEPTTSSAIELPEELLRSGAFGAEPNLATGDGQTDDAPERIKKWRKSLLDLSLRNPLLKLPTRSKGVDLHIPDSALAVLDDRIHQGKHVRVVPDDKIGGVNELRGVKRAQELDGEVVAEELRRDNRVYGAVPERSYVNKMRGLQRDARTIQQETGGNYLYLTFGTLVHPGPSGEAHAPLFLLPVRIEGGTGRSPYTIVIDGDEIAASNYCLIEWLRVKHGVSIPELEEPILDDNGIDIERSFEAIRNGLVQHELNHYRVDEGASLRLLQFSTFQMWRDLTDHWEEFLTNPVVRHLVDKPGHQFVDPARREDGDTFDESQLHLPIPADGSQMRAITMAGHGRSFVLEGPPGTGKSQTITNLIAHALRTGQKVLFVAEKQAALDVVKRRLADIGLGDFCLDLHGRKQSLPSIKEQLKTALDRSSRTDEHGWKAAEARFRRSFGVLQSYPGQLHTQNPARLSAWDAYGAMLAYGDGPRALVPTEFVTLPAEQQEAVTTTVAELPAAAESAGLRPQHPWAISGHRGVDGLDSAALLRAANELEAARALFHRMPDVLRAELAKFTWPTLAGAALPSARLAAAGRLPGDDATKAAAGHGWDESMADLLGELERFHQTHSSILSTFRPEFFTHADFPAWETEAAETDKGFLGLFGKKKKRQALAERLRPYLADGADLDAESIRQTVEAASRARAEASKLVTKFRAVPGMTLPEHWVPTLPDAVTYVCGARDELVTGRTLRAQAPAIWQVLNQLGSHTPAGELERFVAGWGNWLRLLATGDDEFRRWTSDRSWAGAWDTDGPAWCNDLRGQGLLPVQRWAALLEHTDVLAQHGLSDYREQILAGAVPSAETQMAYLRGYAHAALRERFEATQLQYFDPEKHEHHVGEYLRLAGELRQQLPERLAHELLAQRPTIDEEKSGNDREFVRHLTTTRRGKNRLSFRQLLAKYPDAVTGLTPCFLMSPASVANFLEPGAVEFDLVVFDEASQIRVPQAVGAMGRARAAVVVGDSKQMPPTSIMEASHGGESDEITDEEAPPVDLDSILEECVESGLEQEWLSWHYRSSDETLITFSNRYYYEGKLQSLPAPGGSPHTGIGLRRVDGVFDRGRTRTNEVEAHAIVEQIAAMLSNPDTAKRSVGVVTFNVPQRDMILNLLEDSENERIQQALAAEDEPLFVKNLENVQGDERDVILFSVAFSKDPDTGKLPMQWGPMSSAGGERRFNVAVTRARQQVLLLCSFDPKDIDLARTNSVGLRHLRAYLELAAGGFDQLEGSNTHEAARSARILNEVANELRARGHAVATNLGLSEFTVDLAVSAPGAQRWQVAVLLDGPTWSARPTVADRDAAPDLLGKVMRWDTTIRIWLPAWVRDRHAILGRIDRAIANASNTEARSDESTRLFQPIEPHNLPDNSMSVTTPEPEPEAGLDARPDSEVETEPVLVARQATAPPPQGTGRHAKDVAVDNTPTYVEPRGSFGVDAEPFMPYEPSIVASRDTLDQLEHSQRAQHMLREIFEKIVDYEGPIEVNRLAKRALNCFDLDRVRENRIRAALAFLPRTLERRKSSLGTWVWPSNLDPETWQGYRQTQDSTDRNVDEIAPEEIVNAMRQALRSGGSRDSLFSNTLELLGHTRKTQHVKNVLGSALEFGVQSGRLPIEVGDT